MNTAVALKPNNHQIEFTQKQLDLISKAIAPTATPDELKLFLYRCQNMGLDPMKPGQIHFVKYGTGPGTIVVGIEGFRSIAARTGKMSGIRRGVTKDEQGKILAGWCEVFRSDWSYPAREEVPFAEYNTNKGPWSKMPETMIKKVAEAAALRMAFPDDLGGVYEKSEMDQAKEAPPVVAPEDPGVDNGVVNGLGYRVTFGKYSGKSLEQIAREFGLDAMKGYVNYLEDKAKKDQKPLSQPAQDFIAQVEKFIGAIENNVTEDDVQ